MAKVMINMDEDLRQQIDDFADARSMSRSASISLMCSEYIRQMENEKALNALIPLLKSRPDLDVKISDLLSAKA